MRVPAWLSLAGCAFGLKDGTDYTPFLPAHVALMDFGRGGSATVVTSPFHSSGGRAKARRALLACSARRDQSRHLSAALGLHGCNQGVCLWSEGECVSSRNSLPVDLYIVVVYERFTFPMRGSAINAHFIGIVEAGKEAIQLRFLVPTK